MKQFKNTIWKIEDIIKLELLQNRKIELYLKPDLLAQFLENLEMKNINNLKFFIH